MGQSGQRIDLDKTAENIKNGINIDGVEGVLQEGASSNPGGGGAVAGYMLNSINAYDSYMHVGFDWVNNLWQHETLTHIYYCYEAYFAGGGGDYYNHIYIIKLNKNTKIVDLQWDVPVNYETSGGSRIATSLTRTTDGAGNYRGLYSDDGQLDFNTNTDTMSSWNYSRHSHNKLPLVGGTVLPIIFTQYGGGAFRLKVYYGTNYLVMRQYRFLEIQ